MFTKKKILLGGALLAATLTPGLASADFVLDTGVPAGSSSTAVSNAQWVAAQFTLTQTEDITSIAAYIDGGTTGQVGVDAYSYDIYNSSLIGARGANRTADMIGSAINGLFTVNDGWNVTSTDVTLGPGTYWIAIQATTSQTKGLYLPSEVSTGTGTAPAGGFAWYSGSSFSTSGAPTFGIEVTATPVPVPAALWLLASGVGLIGSRLRRRQAS